MGPWLKSACFWGLIDRLYVAPSQRRWSFHRERLVFESRMLDFSISVQWFPAGVQQSWRLGFNLARLASTYPPLPQSVCASSVNWADTDFKGSLHALMIKPDRGPLRSSLCCLLNNLAFASPGSWFELGTLIISWQDQTQLSFQSVLNLLINVACRQAN